MKKFEKIRTEIKRLSQMQVELKPQRKTVNFTGERTIDAEQASYLVFDNKFKLRHLYHAYALLKGKELPKYKEKTLFMESVAKKYAIDYAPEEVEKVA